MGSARPLLVVTAFLLKGSVDLVPSSHDALCELWLRLREHPVAEQEPVISVPTVHKSLWEHQLFHLKGAVEIKPLDSAVEGGRPEDEASDEEHEEHEHVSAEDLKALRRNQFLKVV